VFNLALFLLIARGEMQPQRLWFFFAKSIIMPSNRINNLHTSGDDMNKIEPIPRDDARITDKLAKHKAYWEGAEENSFLHSLGVFAPSLPIHLPQPDGSSITQAKILTADMVNPAEMVSEVENWLTGDADVRMSAPRQSVAVFGNGDLLPFSQPFHKIPWLEAMLGCPIMMTEGQIWNEHYTGGAEAFFKNGVDLENNPWFELYKEMIRQLQSRLGDRFPVTANTLFRGTCDLVAAVIGVAEACMAWIQEPKLMAKLLRVVTDVHLAVVEAGNALLKPIADGPLAGGYMSGFGIWTPAPVSRMQADHSTLLSPDMYKEQILPFDKEIIKSLPYCIFHLHNPGLHVAPALLEIDELNVIEVVVDPYPSDERKPYEMDMYKRILEQKPLLLDFNFPSWEEAEWVVSELPHRGLNVNARFAPDVLPQVPDGEPAANRYFFK
jgi:hypothetical protein